MAKVVDLLFSDWENGPGGAVTVVHEGDVVHHAAYGLADVEADVAFATHHPFAIASLTKQFVAYLVLLLEQRGLVDRTEPVSTYIPQLGELGATVTVEHLLRHRSGLRDHITLATLAGGRLLDGLSRESVRSLVMAQRSLDFVPGSAAVYSNANYVVLSWIVERVTHRSLADALTEHVLGPAGMTSTTLVERAVDAPPSPLAGYEGTASTGYRPWQLGVGYVSGDGGMWSTLDDLARWLQHIERASGERRAALDAMMLAVPLDSGGTTDYLVGLREGQLLGERWVGHSGGWTGFRSQTMWFPSRRLGIAVIANQTIDPTAAALEVADRFLPPPPLGLAGIYRNDDLDATWVIEVDRSSVMLSPSGPFGCHERLPLRRTGPRSLVLTRSALARWNLEFDTEITFDPSADGGIPSLDVRSGIVRSLRFGRVD